MINEAFDDDIPDEPLDEVLEAFDAGEEGVTERPKGQFKRNLCGHEIWFKPPIPGQFQAFKRYRNTLTKRFEALAARARKAPSVEMLEEINELAERIDLATLEFFEGILADPGTADMIAMEMIGGRVTMLDIHNAMFVDDAPEDDVAPVVKIKPVRKQTASKAAANAKRTRK